jgi:phthalate 4,5-dioxygenase
MGDRLRRYWTPACLSAEVLRPGGCPAGASDLDYASVRGAEKILEPGEDWRLLGTNADPLVAADY